MADLLVPVPLWVLFFMIPHFGKVSGSSLSPLRLNSSYEKFFEGVFQFGLRLILEFHPLIRFVRSAHSTLKRLSIFS
ncbi:hypothetical protein LINGRAHAP2_LOCUS2095 [Linum grandiflorum]